MNNYFEHEQYSATLIAPNVWHIHDATSSNPAGEHEDGSFNNPSSIYLIEDKTQVFVIDLGNPYQDHHLREMVNQIAQNRTIKVAITHNHFDHIGALDTFNDCQIYVPENDPIANVNHPIYLKENDQIHLDTMTFEVLDVKGHTIGSIAFYEKKRGLLATGDAFGSSYVWLLFIPDVISVYQKTLDKTLDRLKDASNLLFLCGHRYQQQFEPVKGIHPKSPRNPKMDLQYLKDMRTLTDQILSGTANSHEFYAFERNDLRAYTYGCAEIDTYLPHHSEIQLPKKEDKKMKTLYFISGTMGIGKTTISQQLKAELSKSVFLDGDWCWDAHPFIVNEETKQMVLDNITYLLNNFLHTQTYEHIIFCWVMHEQKIIDDLLSRLDLTNVQLKNISLICDAQTLKKRITKDIDNGLRQQEVLSASLKRIPLYDSLNTTKIDTTNQTIENIVQDILDAPFTKI